MMRLISAVLYLWLNQSLSKQASSLLVLLMEHKVRADSKLLACFNVRSTYVTLPNGPFTWGSKQGILQTRD